MKKILPPHHPGKYLHKDVIKALGLTFKATASSLGVSRRQLYEVVYGISVITPEMAMRIEKAFGVEATLWLELQARYDLGKVINSGKVSHIKSVCKKKLQIHL